MKSLTTIFLIASLGVFTSCASDNHRHHNSDRDTYYGSHKSIRESNHYGEVTDIRIVNAESHTSGGGAVLGAVIGGVIGHQLGSGRGNDVATGLGAVGGAVAGNNIEKRRRGESEIYRITVRMHNGDTRQYDYSEIGDLQVGDKVRVEGDQLYLP